LRVIRNGSGGRDFICGLFCGAHWDLLAGFLMQSEEDAERVRALGAPAERVKTSGVAFGNPGRISRFR